MTRRPPRSFTPGAEPLEARSLLATIFDIDTGLSPDTVLPGVSTVHRDFATGTDDNPAVTSGHGDYLANLFADTETRTGRHDSLIVLKADSPGGTLRVRSVVAALDYVDVYAHAHRNRNVVATLPFAGSGTIAQVRPILRSIARLARDGVPIACAAGNDARDVDLSPEWPASAGRPGIGPGNVLTVAATDATGHLQLYSDYGRKTVQVGVRVGERDGTSGAALLAGIALGGQEDAAAVWRVTGVSRVEHAHAMVRRVVHAAATDRALRGRVGSGGEVVDVGMVGQPDRCHVV